MATISYDEKFIITKQEMLDRLERVALKFQPAEMRNKNAINEMKCGLKEELETICPICREPITIHWHFSENDLLNKIPLEQLFENILSISKYANFQIDDSLAYGEVEVMCQVVNKMIEEDNKALNESEGQQTIYSGA